VALLVGSVEVEIIPTTKRFKQLLKPQAESAAASVGDGIGKTIADRVAKSVGDGIVDGADKGFRRTQAPAREQGRKSGDDFGGAFATQMRRHLDAATRALPDVKIDADTSDADLKIAGIREDLAALRDAHIGVDLDEGEAVERLRRIRADLAELQAERPSVQITVDAAAAAAELEAIKTEADSLDGDDVHVDVDVDDHGSISGATANMGGMLAAGLSLAPALIPVAGAIAAAFAGIGVGVLAGIAGIGVAVLGLHGIGDAVKATGQAQQNAGKDAAAYAGRLSSLQGAEAGLANAEASAADSRTRSAEQVANAQRNLGVAQREAANAVRDAERNLTDAQKQATAAQQALNAARQTAKEQLEDLALQVADGALSQRQATLDLQGAQDNLAQVLADPQSSKRQREQAQLTYDQAKQQIEDLGVRQKRLAAEKTAADKAGINGSKVVRAAEDNAAQARDRVAQAQQKLAETQAQSVERVASAQRAITDAVRAQVTAQRQSAASIASAQRGVESARRSMADTAGSAAKAREAMDGLSPAGRRFATFLTGTLLPKLHSIRDAASEGLLPGLQDGLTALLPAIPGIAQAVGGIASGIGGLFAQAGQALASPFWQGFLRFAAGQAKTVLPLIGRIIGGIAKGFAGLAEAAAPLADKVLSGLADAVAGFARGTGSASFAHFLDVAAQDLPTVLRFLGALAVFVVRLVIAFAPVGLLLLQVTTAVLAFLSSLDPAVLAAVAAGVAVLAAVLTGSVGLIILAIVLVVGAVVYAWTHFETFRQVVTTVAHAIAAAATAMWNDFLHPIFNAIAFVITRVLAPTIAGFYRYYWHPIFLLVVVALRIAWAAIQILFGLIELAWKALAASISFVWEHGPKQVFGAFAGFLHDHVLPAVKTAVTAIGKAWEAIEEITKVPIRFVVNTVLNDGIIHAYNKIAGFFHVHQVDPIQLPKGFAAGGAIYGPGTGTSDSVLARLSNGEHVWTAREVAAAGGHAAVESMRGAVLDAAPGFADGGIVGAIKHKAGQAAHGVAGAGKAVGRGAVAVGKGVVLTAKETAEIAKNPIRWITDRITGALTRLGDAVFDSDAGRILTGVPKKIGQDAIDYVKAKFGGAIPGVGTPADGAVPANLSRTAASASVADVAARTAAILGRPGEAAGWARRIMFESGGNWSAVNKWDSNWVAGHPSVGGAQVIAGTFASNAGPYRSIGPFLYGVSIDPLANSYAGAHYAIGRYGSLAAVDPLVRPVGYDAGGVLPPGASLVYNGTGRPEPVLTADQWDRVAGGNTRTFDVDVHNYGRDLTGWDVARAIRQQEALIPAFAG
jgi:hypothetical protein